MAKFGEVYKRLTESADTRNEIIALIAKKRKIPIDEFPKVSDKELKALCKRFLGYTPDL